MIESISNSSYDDKFYIKIITDNLCNIIKMADSKRINLSESDHNDIDEIINCLQDLEHQRLEAHHVWEIESIKFEALRHKLTLYPLQITEEIQKAISAARGLNEKTIDDFRRQLNSINSSIDKNTDDLDRFNIENEKLIPHLKNMKLKHDEIVVLLNQHLAVKADRQINLNQIRDKIKKNNEKIVELEEDVFQLKETMIKERAAAREEKKRLMQETNVTQGKLDDQNSKNQDLNKIYLNLKHEAAETTMAVNEKLSTLSQYENTIGILKKRRDELESQIEDTKWSNVQLKEEIQKIEDKSAQSKYDFLDSKSQLEEEISMFTDTLRNQKMIQFELLSVKEEASEELERSQKIHDEVSLNLRSLMENLKNIEEHGAAKAGDIGLLDFEMEEMERNIVEAKEMHEATVMAINSQVTSLKKQLEKERKERLDVQKDNSKVQDEINLFRAEHVKFMREINSKINDSKSEHSRLQTQYQMLKKKIQEEVTESNNLKKSILDNGQLFQKDESELTEKISNLVIEISNMENEERDLQRILEENEPNLKELQIYYDRHLKDYEKLKKNLAGLKNRKNVLDDSMERTTRSLAKENVELEKLKLQKQQNENQLDKQIESESSQRSDMEKSIYVLGCKTSTVKDEIAYLEKLITEINSRMRILRDNWEKAIRISSKLKQDLTSHKTILANRWTDDDNLELEFRHKESDEIRKLDLLLLATEERGSLVATVSEKLYSEIKAFDQFLVNMATIPQSKANDITKGVVDIIKKIGNLEKTVQCLELQST